MRTISVTSSTTPGMVENSCFTPPIRTAVTAVPSMEERRTRLKELPTVTPKPLSKGSAMKAP